MKIAVVGSGGRLGAALARHYRERHEVTGLDRQAMDLRDARAIRDTLGALDIEVLLNPAALTAVDYCEDHESEARAVNALAPGIMAAICREKGARMIHISTDYVFDGAQPGARVESDAANPLSVYGRSKLAGEKAVHEVSPEFLVIRTSWVFGPDRPSFIDWILESALEKDRVEAIEDKFSSPTLSEDFAGLLEPLLDRPQAGGVLHLCNRGACSWREYGQAAIDCAAGAGLPLRTSTVEGIRLSALEQFVAVRPVHTAMSTEKYTALTGVTPRAWEEAVKDFVKSWFAPRWRAGRTA